MAQYPESLTIPDIYPVVTLVGSTYLHNFITDIINSNRLSFESVEYGHHFETRKDRQGMNDGIIKVQWPNVRRKFIPACALMIFDWSQSAYSSPPLENPDWRYKEQSIANEIRRVREQNRGRILKIAIIVILSGEIQLDEKATLVRKQNDLDSKGIYFITGGIDGIKSFVRRLEKYLYDSTMAHYKDEVDRYKKLKTKAYRENGWPEVQIRYSFKLGYLFEHRRDKESALSYYKTAYNDLKEMQPNSIAQANEMRSVGDWILVRIFTILLTSGNTNRFNESLDYFRAHVARFRDFQYDAEDVRQFLDFERYKWLFEQYAGFGNLLDQYSAQYFNKINLWTLPSFYFQSAAMYLIKRKMVFADNETLQAQVTEWQTLIANTQMKTADPLYVGQASALASHPLEQELSQTFSTQERNLIIKTVAESETNYISTACEYLIKAYKFNKSKKIMEGNMNYILAVLSELYSSSGDFENSKVYKLSIAKSYKQANWSNILKFIYQGLLDISQRTQNPKEIFEFSITLLGYEQSPEIFAMAIGNLSSETSFDSTVVWESIKVSTSFAPNNVCAYDEFLLNIDLTSQFSGQIQLAGISVQFSDPTFDGEVTAPDSLLPGIEARVQVKNVVRDKSVTSLELVGILVTLNYPNKAVFKLVPEDSCFAKLVIKPPADLINVTFNHSPPALIGERYSLSVQIDPACAISSGSIQIIDNSDNQAETGRRASVDSKSSDPFLVYHNDERVPELSVSFSETSETTTIPLEIVFQEDGTHEIIVYVTYQVNKQLSDQSIEFSSDQSYPLSILVFPPFDAAFTWKSAGPGEELALNTPLVLLTKLTVASLIQTPVKLHDLQLDLPSDVAILDSSAITDTEICEGQCYSCIFLVKIIGSVQNIGDLIVTWSRRQESLNTCRLPLPLISPRPSPFTFELRYPHEVSLGSTFPLNMAIKNNTGDKQVIRIRVASHEGFLLAGLKNSSLEIDTEEVAYVDYILFPEKSGKMLIPYFSIQAETLQDYNIVDEKHTSAILVLP